MTANEFALLALGLAFGVAGGAALVIILRSRPPGKREVRVTVTPNAIAGRRATTLADSSAGPAYNEPARGGPGDVGPQSRNAADGRTGVPIAATPTFRLAGAGADSIGIAIAREPDPMMSAIRATAASARALVPSGTESSAELEIRRSPVALAEPEPAEGPSGDRPSADGPARPPAGRRSS